MWDLEFGDKYEWFMQLEADGHHVGELEKKPELYPDLALDYNAFMVLSASRRVSMSAAPIPISEIFAYADYFCISGYEQRKTLLSRIRILDRVFLDWHSKQSAKVDKKDS